jgi:hypothetical protein
VVRIQLPSGRSRHLYEPSYPTNDIYLRNTTTRAITSQQGQGGDDVGDQVCESSVTRNDYLCGTVTNVSFDTTNTDGVTFRYLRKTSIRFINSGDSGGPTFWGNQAMGIIHGSTTEGTDGDVYCHIHDAITTAGMRAVKQT